MTLLQKNCLFSIRTLQKFSQEVDRGQWSEAKTLCRQFLGLIHDKKPTIGYPHLAFEAGSHALTCLLWKLHGSALHLEDEGEKKGEGEDDDDDDDDDDERDQ